MGKKCFELEKQDWARVLFWDECRFALKSDDRRVFLYSNRITSEPKNVIEYER